MEKTTKEEKKIILEKLKKIKLDIENVPDILKVTTKIKYKPLKDYDNMSYKVYQFVDVKDIDIYLTPTTRLEDTEKKYKLAKPLSEFLNSNNEEYIEDYLKFIELLKKVDFEEIDSLEKRQKQFQKQIPFEVKYKDNFIWDIYYSEAEDKYFMMFPTEEQEVEPLFYLIKKKLELKKNSKSEYVYVPINNKEIDYNFLKRSEIADLENYLWYFTGNWPTIYELKDKEGKTNIQVVGKTPVYEKVKSLYKIVFNTKEEAQEEFKLIKALFIIQSNMEQEYNFQTGLSKEASLNFYYNHNQIKYETLTEFIRVQILNKKEKISELEKQNLVDEEKYELIKQSIQKQNIEYLAKEKQIVTFLECKKTLFGRVSYFFKSKKKKSKLKQEIIQEPKEEKQEEIIQKPFILEEKEFYTIEDLLKVGKVLQEKEKEAKNKKMDISALEIRKENLENKIKNATLYINEIESHKKSIFDFWKYTNKDEVSLLQEGETKQNEENHPKIKKSFSYEEDLEDFGEKIDEKQRRILTQKETDSIFAIYQDVETFNLLSKEKLLKKDDKQIQSILMDKQEQYQEEYEQIKQKDYDIFGSVVEDKTKIKILKNHKHREIGKDQYKILDIHLDTTLEEYKDNIRHYEKILEESYNKVTTPYDISAYKLENKTIENEKWVILNLNPKEEVKNLEGETLILNRINIKEGMNAIFYSNIMFYDNLNQTLPLGMDISTQMLFNMKEYEFKLVSRKDFNMNFLENEFQNEIKTIQVYEYDIEERK